MTKEGMRRSIDGFITKEREAEKSKNTVRHYAHVLNLLYDFLPDGELNKTSIIDFKEHLLESGFEPSTVQNYITIVNKWLKYAKMKRFTVTNIKVQGKASLEEEELLTPEDFMRLLRQAKRTGRKQYCMIMEIMGYTGIRLSELQYFTVENIRKPKLLVHNKGKIRTIIMPTSLKKKIKKYIEEQGIESGYIFPGKKEGTMLHPTTVYKNIRKIAAAAKIKKTKAHPHAFRHLFAVRYIEEGGQPSDLADILGHSQLETTAIYTRTTDKMKKIQVEKINYRNRRK